MAASYSGVDPGSTSVSLIKRAKLRDGEAWERLCHIYGPLVYRWIRGARMSDADAAEIGQEVFLTVSRRIDAFDPANEKGAFRGWLRGIARNKIGDRIRALRRSVPAEAMAEELLSPEEPDSELRSTSHALLRRALQTLEPEFESRTWAAFQLTVFEDRPASQVASELAMTPQAVRQARYRILSRLRILMRDERLG